MKLLCAAGVLWASVAVAGPGTTVVTGPVTVSGAADVTPPTLSTVSVDGSTWTFTYDEAVTATTTADLCDDYAVSMSTAGAITLAYSADDGTGTVTCTGSPAVVNGETVTSGLNYTPGTIVDASANALALITGRAVTNATAAAGGCGTPVGVTSVPGGSTQGTNGFFISSPFVSSAACSMNRLDVYASFAGTATCKMAVYADNGAGNPTGDPLAQTANFSVTSSTTWYGAATTAAYTTASSTTYHVGIMCDQIVVVDALNASGTMDYESATWDILPSGAWVPTGDQVKTISVRWSYQ